MTLRDALEFYAGVMFGGWLGGTLFLVAWLALLRKF